MDRIGILLTGAGAPGSVGTLEALKQAPFQYRVVGVDTDPLVANRFLLDAFHVVPRPERPEFIDALRQIVTREDCSILLPQVTRELLPLASSKESFAQLGCQVLVNDPDKMQILNNKHRLMQSVRRLGLAVPEHYLVNTKERLREAAHQLGYPAKRVVVKPPVSNGMRGLRILTESADRVSDFLNKKPDSAECSLNDLLAIFPGEEVPDLLVCQYLPGTEISVDCLCQNGKPVVILPRTRDKIRSGITFSGTSVRDDRIVEQCARIIRGLNLDHVIGFQFKCTEEGTPLILECNPRIQGTMVLGAFCGANVVVGVVCQALGIPWQLTQAGIEWDVKISRYWGGIVHKGDALIGRF